MMKEMCSQAGLSTEFTNHSLRAYGATSLFQANVLEKSIQQRTGHKSLKALRQYECTSECQLLDVSNVVSNCAEVAVTSVSVVAEVSVSMPLSTMAHQSSDMTMARYVLQLPAPVSLPMEKPVHPILLSGCNFNNCTISFSGNTTAGCQNQGKRNPSEVDTTALFEGISVDELYDQVAYEFIKFCMI